MSHLSGSWSPAVGAQNYEPMFDQYDTEVADDFRVDRRCRARSLYIPVDTFSGASTAESATVAFFRDGGDRPGREIWRQNVEAVGSAVELTMPIDPPVRLRPGRDYWVSIQIDLDFAGHGQIAVATTTTTTGAPVLWRNPGDGFGSGCTDWAPAAECVHPDVGRLALEIGTRFAPDAPTPDKPR